MVALVAGLALSGCSSAQESAPDEMAIVWEDVKQRLVSGEGPAPLEIYEEAGISEKQISVDTAGLEYGERAAAIANAVFEETSGDDFWVTSDGMKDGEYIASLEIGRSWPWDETFATRQIGSASTRVCMTVLANDIEISSDDPIAEALATEREQEVVFECVGRLATGVAPINSEIVQLTVPIGQ